MHPLETKVWGSASTQPAKLIHLLKKTPTQRTEELYFCEEFQFTMHRQRSTYKEESKTAKASFKCGC